MKQTEDKRTADFEDIIYWSDGTWCYRYELEEMNHMSDDFSTIQFGSLEYNMFLEINI